MASSATLTREQVLSAISRLENEGIPDGAQSTKYDLIGPDGNPWPPKAVLELAVEIATGTPFPRTRFSGGDETNDRLSALGFEIRLKPGLKASTLALEELKPGMEINNDDLVDAFSVGNAGGMRWSSSKNCLVIIADHTKSLYDDHWDGDFFWYTGMGKLGDQSLTGQNHRLAQQTKTGIAVHLFEVFEQNRYVYAGLVGLSGSVKSQEQPDEGGHLRKVFVFPLRLLSAPAPPIPTAEQLGHIKRNRQRKLKSKSLDELKVLANLAGTQSPGYRSVAAGQYERNEAVAEYVKRAAGGACGLCNKKAPFETSDGPYLECHHVTHLARGGADSVSNAIALCPNCHRGMHVLDRPADRALLFDRITARDGPTSTQS